MSQTRPFKLRRSCLAVPASSRKMMEKARGLDVDQLFLDLEDACAPSAKPAARGAIVEELTRGGWEGKTVVVRVNDLSTQWTYRDVIEVVEGAGQHLDCIMLPKVQDASQVMWLDVLLTQIEKTIGLPVGQIGIEVQIEDAQGLINVDTIATASPRVETVIFGPGDFIASMNMRTFKVGAQPEGYEADAYHYPLMRLLVAARAAGVQVIDGPWVKIHDIAGFETSARRSAALGFDGKWILHPGQAEAANAVFTPAQDEFDHAQDVIEAYAYYTSDAGGQLGGAMLGDLFIDEAIRKIAAAVDQRGRLTGMQRASSWTPPAERNR